MSYFTKNGLTRLIDALNLHNPQAKISIDDIAISNPVIINDQNRNTSVVITADPNSEKFKGRRTIKYNRLDLQETFDSLTTQGLIISSTVNTTHDLLPLILAQHNVLLEPVDIVLENLSTAPYVLRATTSSYGWLGEVTIEPGVLISYEVIGLDDGSVFGLDDGSYLNLIEDVE